MYIFVASKVNLYSYKLRRGGSKFLFLGYWTAIKGAHTKTVVCRFTVRFRICLLNSITTFVNTYLKVIIFAELIFAILATFAKKNSSAKTCRNMAIAEVSSAKYKMLLFCFVFTFTHLLRFCSFYCLVDRPPLLAATPTYINIYVQQSITRL